MGRGKAWMCLVAAVVIAWACSDPLAPTLLTVTPTPITLGLGESTRLTASLRDETGAVVVALTSWSSSAPSIVSVNDGFVTALQPGTAEVTASASDLTASATVTVEDQEQPEVTVLSPVSGATVAGILSVAARVSDDHKLSRVSLSVDGVEVDTTEPAGGADGTISLLWDTDGASDGTHTLLVEATDSTGNIGGASLDVFIDTPAFVLSITGAVTSSGFNTATGKEECTSVITATATGGAAKARAEWLSGQVEYRDVNGIVMSTDTLDAGHLLDYFGSSHISTGATQVVNRVDRQVNKFDALYTFRAALPDATRSSIAVFMDCN